jgi:hypothetical protein
MSEHLDQVPMEIQAHIRDITKSSGLPDTEESVDMIAEGWLEKKERFERITERMHMEDADILEKADERGCLVMTYSGSLLSIGPLRDGGRSVQYASIGLRTDVPPAAEKDGSQLQEDARVGAPVAFTVGPITASSPVFKIALTSEDLDLKAQEVQVGKATKILTKEFVTVNRELTTTG